MKNVIESALDLSAAPVVIAEVSANHNGSLSRAKEIIKAAVEAGARAIKLQTYTADTMTLDSAVADFVINDPNSLWYGRKLYELYQEAHTPWEWHGELFAYARKLGADIFSTPFDSSAVDFLEQFNPSCYKVASFEATDIPLLIKIAATRRPVIISSGMCNEAELVNAINTLRANGTDRIIILKCTSAYPAPVSEMNLNAIKTIAAKFSVTVGLSDHTLNHTSAITAVALGARVIEKHFTISRSDGGPDAAFSLEPAELAELIKLTREAWSALGDGKLQTGKSEAASKIFRRSVYAVKDIAEGEKFTVENIRVIRPGYGLDPADYEKVLGRSAKQIIKRGTAIKTEMFYDSR